MVHVTIYSSTMDPMGYYLSNHRRLYPSNPRRWFHRPPQRSTVPLEAALPQEPTKTVLFPGLADWNMCTCSSTSMSKKYPALPFGTQKLVPLFFRAFVKNVLGFRGQNKRCSNLCCFGKGKSKRLQKLAPKCFQTCGIAWGAKVSHNPEVFDC
jgi:hypothetical protein